MKKVYVNRLLKLAEFLKTVPRKRFNINAWRYEQPRCGTVCCAGGWACTIPAFRRAGLKLVKDKLGAEMPTFEGETSLEALQAFFGIDDAVADSFFVPMEYGDAPTPYNPTPKFVAKRIERFVKQATSPAAKAYKKLRGQEVTEAEPVLSA